MNDNVIELKQPVPEPPPEEVLSFDDLRFTHDLSDGWVYVQDEVDDLAVIALSEDEAKALRDWLIKVLPA